MSALIRLMGWAWLMAGLIGVGAVALAGMGAALPVHEGLGMSLSIPWSLMIPVLNIGHKLELLVMAVGVFINAQILFVIANVLKT